MQSLYREGIINWTVLQGPLKSSGLTGNTQNDPSSYQKWPFLDMSGSGCLDLSLVMPINLLALEVGSGNIDPRLKNEDLGGNPKNSCGRFQTCLAQAAWTFPLLWLHSSGSSPGSKLNRYQFIFLFNTALHRPPYTFVSSTGLSEFKVRVEIYN